MDELKPAPPAHHEEKREKHNQHDIGFALRQRLETILTVPLTPENVETYISSIKDQIILLVADAVEEYVALYPDITLPYDKDYEDHAFNHFGLQNINETLDDIQKKENEMAEVVAWMQKNIAHTPDVIVPPGLRRSPIVAGECGSEQPGTKSRLQTLLFILRNGGVPFDSIFVVNGILTDQMMRKVSYHRVSLPSLNRTVLVCDEAGNASYFFDTSRLESLDSSGARLQPFEISKEEINKRIKKHPGTGIRLVYSSIWTERVRSLLFEAIPNHDLSLVVDNKEVPRVSVGELDPWRGFWTDPNTGTHYGAKHTIAKRMRIAPPTLEKKVDWNSLLPVAIRQTLGGEMQGFPYEDIERQSTVATFLAMPLTEVGTGEWRGFCTDPNTGTHYGPVKSIVSKIKRDSGINVDPTNAELIRVLGIHRENIRTVRPIKGHEREAYPYEDIFTAMKEYLSSERVPYKVIFTTQEREQMGSLQALATHFGVDYFRLRRAVINYMKHTLLQYVDAPGPGARGMVRIYRLKDIEPIAEKLKQKAKVAG